MKQSKNTAYGGVFIALTVCFLYLASISPVLKAGLCAIAGLFPALRIMSGCYKNAFLIYIASSILAAILVPNKWIVILYITFFGLYSFAKYGIECKFSRRFQWVAKVVFCNFLLLLYAKFSFFMFSSNLLVFDNFPNQYAWYPVHLAINVAFILYDIVFSKLIFFLKKRIQF